MNGNAIVLKIDGLEFRANSREDEPMVLDTELAGRLGYARPRAVRDLIKRLLSDGTINDSEVCRTVVQTTKAGGRPSTEYWLVETGALKVMAKSDTPRAIAGLDQLVRSFVAARKLLAVPPIPSAPALTGFHALLAACKTVGENPTWHRELFQRIGYVAYRDNMSWARVHGGLRRYLGVVSYLRIPATMLDETRRYLDMLAGKAPAMRAAKKAPAQLDMFGVPVAPASGPSLRVIRGKQPNNPTGVPS